ERIAPKLPRRGKIIGWHARDERRSPLAVELKQLWSRPDISRIGGDEDRHVADQLHAKRGGIVAKPMPLAEKKKLSELAKVDWLGKFMLGAGQGGRIVPAMLLGPLPPGHAPMPLFQGEEQSERIEPLGLSAGESGEQIGQVCCRASLEPSMCQRR